MAYDKKTGTISTNGDRREFEKDMFAHFKHVEAQVDSELAKKANETKSITLQERIKLVSRLTKISMILFVVWTLFVSYRTLSYHELLGMDFQRWDEDSFLVNWLVVPAAIFILYKAVRWALRGK